MTIDKRVGKKITEFYDRNLMAGIRIDPGPYEATVKSNVDPARHGRLQVYIPEMGGNDDQANNNPDNPTYWRTVSYMTPFYGVVDPDVYNPNGGQGNQTNAFGSTKQSYGMWFVPPDPGTKVLVIFANGDPNRGYWIGCIPDGTNHYMVPGIASSTTLVSGASVSAAPVTEFNDNVQSLAINTSFLTNPKPVHTPQEQILVTQGLQNDTIRGLTTSSSQRDVPSGVFGISTPGRPYPDPAQNPQYQAQLQNNTLSENAFQVTARSGGHTFVMDDGDVLGNNQMFKLRSATGHQLLMHDTGGIMYIGNSTGTVWIELTNAGNFNMFLSGDMSIHGTGNLNMQFDKNVNIGAGGNINLNAKGNIQCSGGNLYGNMKGDTNFTTNGNMLFKSGASFNAQAGSGGSILANGRLEFNGSTIGLNDGGGASVSAAPAATGPTIIPQHEPWTRPVPAITPSTIAAPSPGAAANNSQLTTDTTKNVTGKGVSKPASKSAFFAQAVPPGGVGSLTQTQTQALMAQIGQNESNGNYSATGGAGGNYLGKYQIGAGVLVSQGYISQAAYKSEGNAAVYDPNAWTGQNGINSADDYLSNPSVQDQVMYNNLQNNYNSMVSNGGIQSTDDAGTVGGMLQTAHLLGAGGAANWRSSGSGQDAFGTTGTTYFNQGRYATTVLANAGSSSNTTSSNTSSSTTATQTVAFNGFGN
jgi:hypothetical protein